MNKEILEITKEFHDTYEKLANEYTYETREDTKVFDINSNNGKLMYATVNEIVSPILKENKILRENAENNDKIVDNVNWENMLLKKENQELNLELSGYRQAILNDEKMLGLKEQNKKLNGAIQTYDILLKANFEENKRPKDNWNKLKNFLEEWKENEEYCYLASSPIDRCRKDVYGEILDKMQELEQGSDE